MTRSRAFLLALALAFGAVLATGAARAQAASQCSVPSSLPQPRMLKVDPDEINRRSPDYYALALSWSPAFCAGPAGHAAASRFQCADNAFAMVVHGLWGQSAQSRGAQGHPRHCARSLVDRDTVARTLCTMPGVQLIQGEWQKHGTCTDMDAPTYFARTRALWEGLHKPDIATLAGADGTLSAGAITRALVEANRPAGLFADAVAVQAGRGNTFAEVLVCYDLAFHFTACHLNKADDSRRLRVILPMEKNTPQ